MPAIRKFTPFEAELPDVYPSLISNRDLRRMEYLINKKSAPDTKATTKTPKAHKKTSPAKEGGPRKGKKPQSTKGSAPKAQVQKQEILTDAGPVKTLWPQYQPVPLRLEQIQQQQEQEKLSVATEQDITQQEKPLATLRPKKATVWHEDDGVVDYKLNPSLSLSSVPDISAPVSSAGSSTYKGSETESADLASLKTAQAWYDRAGADIVVVVRTPSGERHEISVHRDIVSRRCGWIRPHRQQKQKTSQVKVAVIPLDMDIAEAEACLCFAYTGGQTDLLLRNQRSGVSAGQAMLQGCSPNRKDVFDLSSLPNCLRLYGAALKLQMPELCRHVLKQMETLATNMGELACLHRYGVLNSNIWGTSQALEAAMTFMYTQLGQDQWRPMRIAFAGLYDAISLRVGPYLTFSMTPTTQQLVERLHGDHIEYRQLQRSCVPEHGSLVASLKEMKLTVNEKEPKPFWYDTESYRQTYQDGSMNTLCKILPPMYNERETPRCMWD